eukprot:COSAG03_NODE_719_length_6112_cov_89.744553_4_plen_63_part_00
MHLTITPAQYKKLNEMGRKGGGSIPRTLRGALLCCVSSLLMLAAKSAGRPELVAAVDDGAPH